MLHAVLGPAHRHAEAPRGEGQQHDVDVDAGLHAERAAGVRGRQQPQPRGPDAERGGRDAVEREGALEVRPRGHRAADGVPVGHHAVALDRRRGRARVAEALAHHEVGPGEGGVGVAVREAPLGRDVGAERVVDRRQLAGQRGRRAGDDRQRLVLDDDPLERVLGDVAVAREHHADGLADVADVVDGRGVVRDAVAEGRREGPGELADVVAVSARRARRRPRARRTRPATRSGRARRSSGGSRRGRCWAAGRGRP